MSTAVVPSTNGEAIQAGERGLVLHDLEQMWRFATCVHKSGLAPKGLDGPEKILVALQMGAELGLSPMSALQNVGVINGKPGVFGDAALALCRASGLMESFDEWLELKPGQRVDDFPAAVPDTARAVCVSTRRGEQPRRATFSVADARRAGLWDKAGPWKQYPGRMLMFRARGFNLRDNFPDVLKGFKTTEELADYPRDERPARRAEALMGQAETVECQEPSEQAERPERLAELQTQPAGKPVAPRTPEELAAALSEMDAWAAGQALCDDGDFYRDMANAWGCGPKDVPPEKVGAAYQDARAKLRRWKEAASDPTAAALAGEGQRPREPGEDG